MIFVDFFLLLMSFVDAAMVFYAAAVDMRRREVSSIAKPKIIACQLIHFHFFEGVRIGVWPSHRSSFRCWCQPAGRRRKIW